MLVYPPQRRRYVSARLHLVVDTQVVEWWAALDVRRIARYRRLVAPKRDCAVIVHSGRGQLLGRFIAAGHAPVIAVAHTDNLRHRLSGRAVFCVNHRIAQIAREAWRGEADRHVFVVPNPLSVPASEQADETTIAARPIGTPDGKLRIGALGQFLPHKGFHILLRALRSLVGEGLAFCAVIGGDGPERANLKSMASSLGLGESVAFPGWVYDKRAFFDGIDLFCLPSLSEPFGLVVTEAMAYGRPVIVSDADGPSEIVAHGKTGWIVPRGHAAALASGIIALAADRSRMTALAVQGNRHARTAFCYHTIGERLRDSISAVLGKGEPRLSSQYGEARRFGI